MGLFETIKNTFSRTESEADVTAAPSQVLREAGLDPSGLKFGFGTGSITVSGTIAEESDRQKILDVLAGIPGIHDVRDDMTIAETPAPRMAENAPASAELTEGEDRTYTVASGDTLWKIAERMYGDGSRYTKIFEANTDVLEHPDRVFPGQKLVIPKL